MEAGAILCIPKWAKTFRIGTKVRLFGKLCSIDAKNCILVVSHRQHMISVDFSLIGPFQDLIGEIYEIYGTLDKYSRHFDGIICSALMITIVQDTDMTIIENSLVVFNTAIHPNLDWSID